MVGHLRWTIKKTNNTHLEFQDVDITIPVYKDRTGRILADVEIEGKKYPFLIDNGARTFIDPSLIKPLGAKMRGFTPSGTATRKLSLRKIMRVPLLNLSGMHFENVYVKVHDFKRECGEQDVYGIIGRGLMHYFIWSFDMNLNEVNISNNTAIDRLSSTLVKIPFKHYNKDYQRILLEINIPQLDKPIKTHLDMGNNDFLSLVKHKLDSTRYPRKQIYGSLSTSLGKKSTVNAGAYYLVDTLEIYAGLKLNDIIVSTDDIVSNLLGCQFLTRYNFTLDFLNEQLILEPIYVEKGDPIKRFWFDYSWDETQEAAVVDYLIEAGPAYNVGLELGDIIQSFDGYHLNSQKAYCEEPDIKGDTTELKVLKRNGQETVYTITRKALEFKTNTSSIYSQNN